MNTVRIFKLIGKCGRPLSSFFSLVDCWWEFNTDGCLLRNEVQLPLAFTREELSVEEGV